LFFISSNNEPTVVQSMIKLDWSLYHIETATRLCLIFTWKDVYWPWSLALVIVLCHSCVLYIGRRLSSMYLGIIAI